MYLGKQPDILAAFSCPKDPPYAKAWPVRLLSQQLLVVSDGSEELVPHVSSLAVGHDGVLGADQVFKILPDGAGRILAHLDLLSWLHLNLRHHVLEGGPAKDLADGEGELEHLRSSNDESEVALLASGQPYCGESLHGEALLVLEAALEVLHVLEEPHGPGGGRELAHSPEHGNIMVK